ncbi:MAG: hypothetical protein WAK90_11945 [Pseudolabrys sp.]
MFTALRLSSRRLGFPKKRLVTLRPTQYPKNPLTKFKSATTAIKRMCAIDRETIRTDLSGIAARFHLLLRAIVMRLAQRLQRPVPERHLITAMRFDMIGSACTVRF